MKEREPAREQNAKPAPESGNSSTPDHKQITRKQQLVSILFLFMAAFIWGMCFVAQRSSMEHVGPFLFNGLRVVLGAATLAAVLGITCLLRKRLQSKTSKDHAEKTETKSILETKSSKTSANATSTTASQNANKSAQNTKAKRAILVGGIVCGLILFFASNLQQIAMIEAPASKAGFITTTYIVLVPIIGIFLSQKTRWNTWVGAAIAVIGLYLLCVPVGEIFTFELSDFLLFCCAIFWALHILFVGRYVVDLTQENIMKLCIVQFLVTAVLSLVAAPLLDNVCFTLLRPDFTGDPHSLAALIEVLPELAYAGFLSTGLAFTFQALGQKHAPPAPAALIMSTESVFGLIGGMVILNEIMDGREIFGCVLMFIAVVLAQLTFKRHSKRKHSKKVEG